MRRSSSQAAAPAAAHLPGSQPAGSIAIAASDQPLTTENREELRGLLARHGAPGEGLDLAGLHGLLTAVVSAPDRLRLQDWLPYVLSDSSKSTASSFENTREYERYVTLVMRMWNEIVRAFQSAPGAFALPEASADAPGSWVHGYRRGTSLSKAWPFYGGVDLVRESIAIIEESKSGVASAAERIARFFLDLRRIDMNLDGIDAEPLSDAELEELGRLIDDLDPNAADEDRDALDLTFLHGMLTWNAALPDPSPVSEATETLFLTEKSEQIALAAETAIRINELAFRLQAGTARMLSETPEEFLPLLQTFSNDGESAPTHVSAALWIAGYRVTAMLSEEQWKPLDRQGRIAALLDRLEELRSEPIVPVDPSLDVPELYDQVANIATDVYDFIAYAPQEPLRVPKTPGRNEPCSCGSGKKYKKCCGAN